MSRRKVAVTVFLGLLAGLILPDPAILNAAEESVPAEQTPESTPDTTVGAPTGYLIGSFAVARGEYPFGAKNFHYNTYEFKYRQLDPERKPATGVLNSLNRALGDEPSATRSDEVHGSIGSRGKFLTNKHTEDFSWVEGTGTVFAISLPEGKYEFYQYFLHQNSGNIQATYQATSEFSIPFEVRAGRATYVGEVRAVNLFAKNMFGIKLADGARWEMHDAFARDEPILKTRFPVLEGLAVDAQVLTDALEKALPP